MTEQSDHRSHVEHALARTAEPPDPRYGYSYHYRLGELDSPTIVEVARQVHSDWLESQVNYDRPRLPLADLNFILQGSLVRLANQNPAKVGHVLGELAYSGDVIARDYAADCVGSLYALEPMRLYALYELEPMRLYAFELSHLLIKDENPGVCWQVFSAIPKRRPPGDTSPGWHGLTWDQVRELRREFRRGPRWQEAKGLNDRTHPQAVWAATGHVALNQISSSLDIPESLPN